MLNGYHYSKYYISANDPMHDGVIGIIKHTSSTAYVSEHISKSFLPFRIDGIFRRANKSDSGHLTLLHSRLSVHQLTTNFSPKLLHTLTIYYIHFCLHCQPPLNPTALDGEHTHINSLDIQPIFRTATSSPACCTKTPIRHYLSFLLCCVCMYMVGECFLMKVWRSLLCSAVRCLYIWLFILYSVHWLHSVMPILQ